MAINDGSAYGEQEIIDDYSNKYPCDGLQHMDYEKKKVLVIMAQKIGIVGASGSGKSTLVNLLQRPH